MSCRRYENDAENRTRFIALWEAGVPTRAMAVRLGISLSTVWEVRRRLNLPARQSGSPGEARCRSA
jgi:hypothetical protein